VFVTWLVGYIDRQHDNYVQETQKARGNLHINAEKRDEKDVLLLRVTLRWLTHARKLLGCTTTLISVSSGMRYFGQSQPAQAPGNAQWRFAYQELMHRKSLSRSCDTSQHGEGVNYPTERLVMPVRLQTACESESRSGVTITSFPSVLVDSRLQPPFNVITR